MGSLQRANGIMPKTSLDDSLYSFSMSFCSLSVFSVDRDDIRSFLTSSPKSDIFFLS